MKEFCLENEDGPVIFSRKHAWLEPLDDRGNYALMEDFWVAWCDDGINYRIRVPGPRLCPDGSTRYFPTDVASVPRWAWSVSNILPDGIHRNAALIHDAACLWQGDFPPNWFQTLKRNEWENQPGIWSRKDVDRLFLRLLKACGVSSGKRYTMYWAVRIGGWWPWVTVDKFREDWRNVFNTPE